MDSEWGVSVSKQVISNPSKQRTLHVAIMLSAGADAVSKQVVNNRCLPSLRAASKR